MPCCAPHCSRFVIKLQFRMNHPGESEMPRYRSSEEVTELCRLRHVPCATLSSDHGEIIRVYSGGLVAWYSPRTGIFFGTSPLHGRFTDLTSEHHWQPWFQELRSLFWDEPEGRSAPPVRFPTASPNDLPANTA